MKTSTATPRADLYTRVTERVIADLEHGVRPWLKPWNAGHAAGRITLPLRHNGTPYRGINILLLWGEAMTNGYASPLWMTFKTRPRRRVARAPEPQRGANHVRRDGPPPWHGASASLHRRPQCADHHRMGTP